MTFSVLCSTNPCLSRQTNPHLSTASRMSLIQAFLSSLDDVWTSYISGPAAEALIKNMPLSSFATSRTISFCRAMTGGFWSCKKAKDQRKNKRHDTRRSTTKTDAGLSRVHTTVANVYFWSFSCRKMSESVRSSARTSAEVMICKKTC